MLSLWLDHVLWQTWTQSSQHDGLMRLKRWSWPKLMSCVGCSFTSTTASDKVQLLLMLRLPVLGCRFIEWPLEPIAILSHPNNRREMDTDSSVESCSTEKSPLPLIIPDIFPEAGSSAELLCEQWKPEKHINLMIDRGRFLSEGAIAGGRMTAAWRDLSLLNYNRWNWM